MAYKIPNKKKGDKLKVQKLASWSGDKYMVYNETMMNRELKKGRGAGKYAQLGTFDSREDAKKFIKENK